MTRPPLLLELLTADRQRISIRLYVDPEGIEVVGIGRENRFVQYFRDGADVRVVRFHAAVAPGLPVGLGQERTRRSSDCLVDVDSRVSQ